VKPRFSSRATLVVIAALFVLPLVFAWLMYSGTIAFKPVSLRNLGELVQPPVPVDWEHHLVAFPLGQDASTGTPALSLDRHWVVLYLVPYECPSACLEAIAGLRQVHKASGRDQSRVRIVLLLPEAIRKESVTALEAIYPLFEFARNPDGTVLETLASIAGSHSANAQGSSYLIDPIGHIMMFYAAGSDPNHLKKDLKQLLTWSKLDRQ